MKLIDTLEDYGLVEANSITKSVSKLPFGEIEKIRNELEEAVRVDVPPVHTDPDVSFNAFNFLASSSFRGESGCSHWECRLRKGAILARYAALFCDQVVVPFRFHPTSHRATKTSQRERLATTLLILSEFRPLLDAGVIVPAPSDVHYCTEHFISEVPQGQQILATQRELAESLYKELRVVYEPFPKYGTLRLTGPEEYLEHGALFRVLSSHPRWLPPHAKTEKSYDLTIKDMRASGIVDSLTWQIAMDAAIQQVYGCRFGCSYLTDRPGEATFLTRISNADAVAARTAALCAELVHSVPLFTDISLDRVMTIRREDHAAFASYRAAVTKIVSENICEAKELSSKEARELYRDVLEPEVLSLEQQAKNERKFGLKNSLTKIGIVTGIVALGAYTGLLPGNLGEWYKAAGGAALGTGLAEVVTSMSRNPKAVRNHNLYFLLRLKQETE
jgi:hypothetical protein